MPCLGATRGHYLERAATLYFKGAATPRFGHGQAPETPILSRCTILDILQQLQRKFFLRQCNIFTQRAEAGVEDEIDHFFQLERLFALEDVHFIFLSV